MTTTISGLGSGIDTSTVITQLMQAEQQPQQLLINKKSDVASAQSAWSVLSSKVQALLTAAQALNTPLLASSIAASTSNSSVVTATASSYATPSTTSFYVNQLASSEQLASASFASASTVVGQGSLTVASGLTHAGLSSVSITDGSASHTLAINNASSGATSVGTTAGLSFASGASFTVATNQGNATVTLQSSYADIASLASDVDQQLAAAGVHATAQGDHLVLATTQEGSAASLTVGGDATALQTLGLTAATSNGSDATALLDNSTMVTIAPGDGSTAQQVGGLSIVAGSHVGTGTVSVATATTTSANATVSDLASALAAAGGPAGAALVDTGSGSMRLVLTGNQTGTANDLTVTSQGLAGFSGAQSGFSVLRASQDAKLTIGDPTSPNAIQLTRSSNTITDLAPGVTINLLSTSTAVPVTVTAATDPNALSTKVKALVDSINPLITTASSESQMASSTGTGANATTSSSNGPLAGDSDVNLLTGGLTDILGNELGSGVTKLLTQLGIDSTSGGTYTFDSTKLTATVQNDPQGAANLLSDLASKIANYATSVNSSTGVISTAQDSLTTQTTTLTQEIADWDTRLNDIQTRYQNMFTQMEVAMAQSKSLGSWLTQQVSGLAGWSTSSGGK